MASNISNNNSNYSASNLTTKTTSSTHPTNIVLPQFVSPNASDSDFPIFKKYADIVCADDESYISEGNLPVLLCIHHSVFIILTLCTTTDPQFANRMLDKKTEDKCSMQDIQAKYFLIINHFEKSWDAKDLIAFFDLLKSCINEIKLKKSEKERINHFILIISLNNAISAMIKANRSDLLLTPICKFATRSFPQLAASDLRREVLTRYSEICVAIKTFKLIMESKDKEISLLDPTNLTNFFQAFSSLNNLIQLQIIGHPTLSKQGKSEIFRAFSFLISTFTSKLQLITSNFNHIEFKDLLENYVLIIGNLKIECSEKEISAYISTHQTIYANFINRIEENLNFIQELSHSAVHLFRFFRTFPLYLELADLTPLISLLDQKNVTPKKIQNFLLEEVVRFSNLASSASMISQVISCLKASKMTPAKNSRAIFNELENFWANYSKLAQSLLNGAGLQIIKDRLQNLFLPELTENRYLTIENTKKEVLIEKPEVKISEKCQETRVHLGQCIEVLDQALKIPEVSEALLNASTHFLNVLCLLHGFVESPKATHYKQDLITLIKNCVRFGSLAVEQVISALYLQSCKKNSKAPLKLSLRHDINFLLYSCAFKAGPLPNKVWNWVKQNNRGEILIRDICDCMLETSKLENFLARTVLYSKGKVSEEKIFTEFIDFLKGIGFTFVSILPQVNASSQQPSSNLQVEVKKLKDSYASGLKIFSGFLSSLKFEEAPQNYIPSPMRIILEKFKSSQGSIIRYNLENSLSNYIELLECELSSQQFLPETGLLAHLSTLLLNNQLIAENFVTNLLDASHVHYSASNDDTHNLLNIVRALEINMNVFSAEETEWLGRGKSLLQMIRYPKSYKSKEGSPSKFFKSVVTALEKANELSRVTAFSTNDSTGKLERKMIQELIQKDLSILTTILNKIWMNCSLSK